jgi:glycosyltransferase involved in cell wall biosynthesis
MRLEAAGYMAPAHKPYLADVLRILERAGLQNDFTYRGEVDRAGKVRFLHDIDVMSMPAVYDEPKGFTLLEAMASGVPIVQPRRGAFVEIVDRAGGGLLVAPDDPDALADGLCRVWNDRALRVELGRRGQAGVREHYTIESSTERLIRVLEQVTAPEIAEGTDKQRSNGETEGKTEKNV